MLQYDLGNRRGMPLYESLYRCIREDILSGTIAAGERLPSKRELARDHGIAVTTAENAYAQLLAEGYITARERSGYFVADAALAGPLARRSTQAAESVPARAPGVGESDSRAYFVDFSSNRIPEDSFPFATWSKLMRRTLADREADFQSAPDPVGVPELREAIAGYLRRAKGMEVDPGRIVVGPGTEYLHQILLQLTPGGRPVAVEDPGYKKIGTLYERNGRSCLKIPVDGEGIRSDLLEGSGAQLVHTSPSHHFPTGCVMSANRRIRLLAWSEREEAYIIEDDYDSEFRLAGRPIPPLANLDDKRVIYMNTFTRTLAPSIRIAYMVLPRELARRYAERLGYASGTVSSFEQYALAAFLREGYYERHISRMRNYYRGHRERILARFESSGLLRETSALEDHAGLHFILRIKSDIDNEKFIFFLEEKGIKMNPLAVYCYNDMQRYRNQFLINYAAIPEESFAEAAARIREAIAESRV